MPRTNSSLVGSPEKTKQKLTEEELLVLQSHLEEWLEAARNDRKAILNAVIKEAKVQAPKMDAQLLKKRKLVSS
jgi:DNA gyrase/topoisomerase IV subunit B